MPSPMRAALLPLVLLTGCSDGPKAPPLTTEAVYQNDKIGLRFLVPDGWAVRSRADLPPGALAGPVVLVAYLQPRGERPAGLDLVAADVPEGDDLARFLAETRIGPEKWVLRPETVPVNMNGAAGTRYALVRAGKGDTRRDVTAFRRGGRVYLFVATFGATDADSRDQARRSVESATWTK